MLMQGFQIFLGAVAFGEAFYGIATGLSVAFLSGFWPTVILSCVALALYFIEQYIKDNALQKLFKNSILSDLKTLGIKEQKLTPYEYIPKLISSSSSYLTPYGKAQKYDILENSYHAL